MNANFKEKISYDVKKLEMKIELELGFDNLTCFM